MSVTTKPNTPLPQPRRVPLTQLARGATARLDAADLATLPEGDAGTLAAMGLRPGCQLRVCKAGQPCIVAVDGHAGGCRIALSRDIASTLCVLPA